MTIPSKPLELTLPASDELRLDDLQLFEADGFSVKGFKAFMARYSKWTAAEIGALTVAETKTVVEQIGRKLNEAAVPKVSTASS